LVGLTTAFVLRALAKSGLVALTPRLMAFVPLREKR
jgi:hypothetical protein